MGERLVKTVDRSALATANAATVSDHYGFSDNRKNRATVSRRDKVEAHVG